MRPVLTLVNAIGKDEDALPKQVSDPTALKVGNLDSAGHLFARWNGSLKSAPRTNSLLASATAQFSR